MPMETLSRAMKRLQAEGYTEAFRAENAHLRALEADRTYAPEDVTVDEILRFEGDTDPSDMAILFAVSIPGDDLRGTWTTSFGSAMSAADAEVARRLETPDD